MDINIDSTKKVSLTTEGSVALYRRYKDFVLPIFVIIACFFVLLFIVIPEISQYLNSRKELEQETQKLNVLKNNYNFLSGLDEKEEESDLKILSAALPPQKDFIGILNALSVASSKTGVSIGDFNFSLGDLSKASQDSSTPSIKIEINLAGGATPITNFIKELEKTVPASEVTSIKTSSGASNLIILFYYKPYPPQNVSDESSVTTLSSQDQALLKDIHTWNNAVAPVFPDFYSGVSSESANLSSQSAGINSSPF